MIAGNEVADGLWKYVRFADGVVLFCDAADMCASHKQIVIDRQADGVPPVSAGTIKVRGGEWKMDGGGSTTARLPQLPSDGKYVGMAIPHLTYNHALGEGFVESDMEWLKEMCHGS